MTKKLLLTIALGTALAVLATGTATSLDLGKGVKVQVPPAGSLPACADLLDNDGDGLTDLADSLCSGPLDTDEGPSGGGDSGGGDGTGGGGGAGQPGATVKGGSSKKKKGKAAPDEGLFGQKAPKGGKGAGAAEREKFDELPLRNPDGTPTNANAGLALAPFGPPVISEVSNKVIDDFEIPPFLLSIFQSYGSEYGIEWQVLASIMKIESDFCRNTGPSSAGAIGCMQFLPSTWRSYGCDGNEDGVKDPYNPVDSVCGAARYLKACSPNLREALFCYNHADWYVDMVIAQANEYAELPPDLIGSITGLTEGAHFPVAADATYADDISEAEVLRRSKDGQAAGEAAAQAISDAPERRSINIYSRVNAPVIAVKDGVIQAMGENEKLGKFIVLTDAYGNRYTYSQLGSISDVHPVVKDRALTAKDFELVTPESGPAPKSPASDDTIAQPPPEDTSAAPRGPVDTEELRQRLFALPERPSNVDRASVGGELDSLLGENVPGYREVFKPYFSSVFKFDRSTMELKPLKVGSQVTGGTVLAQIGDGGDLAPHVNFAIRPAGRGAPKVDPKRILDGWRLLETTGFYHAAGKDPFGGSEATIGQILLMSKELLVQRVLADPRIEIYACGRSDIESGQVDRRVLASLEYLVERGYRLTITSLKCGHSFYTTSGNVSAHSSGNAVDIAQVNGRPILGNQGKGSITEAVVLDLLQLQGTMRPAQIITLMEFGGPTFAMADHDDHIHLGFTPLYGAGRPFDQLAQVLKPDQWERLIDVLGDIENPKVRTKPSDASLPAGKGEVPTAAEIEQGRGSTAHRGE